MSRPTRVVVIILALALTAALPCWAAPVAGKSPLSADQLVYPGARVETQIEVNGAGAVQLLGGVLDAAAASIEDNAKGRERVPAGTGSVHPAAMQSLIVSAKDAIESVLGVTVVVMTPRSLVPGHEFVKHYRDIMSPRGWLPLATVTSERGPSVVAMLAPGGKGVFATVNDGRQITAGMVITSKPLGDLIAGIVQAGHGSGSMQFASEMAARIVDRIVAKRGNSGGAATATVAPETFPVPAPTPLPRLTQPLSLDGDLGEWGEAARMSLRSAADISTVKQTHKWLGPADAGMEVACAWNADGLCLAAVVTDQELINDSAAQHFWQQDCVELFVDGRVGSRFMQPPYSPGAYQLLVRPPVGGTEACAVVRASDGQIAGLRVAGNATADGYVVEVLVPWSAFPELAPQPGARVGISFALDDYDSRDIGKEEIEPLQMSYPGRAGLYENPQWLIPWVLTDAGATPPMPAPPPAPKPLPAPSPG